MKTIHKISTWTLIGLGMLHTLLTPIFYTDYSVDALWFAGTGVALLFLGLFNLAVLKTPTQTSFSLCLAANVIGSLYSILLVIILPEPQVFLSVLAFLGSTAGTVFTRKSVMTAIQ